MIIKGEDPSATLLRHKLPSTSSLRQAQDRQDRQGRQDRWILVEKYRNILDLIGSLGFDKNYDCGYFESIDLEAEISFANIMKRNTENAGQRKSF